jgi:hypothetical protein
MDWHELHIQAHILAFLLMLLPRSLSKLFGQCGEKELKIVLGLALNSVPIPFGFDRFVRYYLHSFPKSSLAECFSLTSLCRQAPPFPTLPPFQNMAFLDQCNLCDDSLGLLKTSFPEYSEAASFHQLSEYKAAHAFYLKGMTHREHYFHGLVRFRTVLVNLTLPTTQGVGDRILTVDDESQVPGIELPVFRDAHCEFFTSFLSQSYVPFFIRAALLDEVYLCLKVAQHRSTQTGISELLKFTNMIWLKTLDKQMMMASGFTWRLNILSDFLDKSPADTPPPVIDGIRQSITTNCIILAKLLAKSGDLRSSLKILKNSVENPQSKPFLVTKLNLSRTIPFSFEVKPHSARLKFEVQILLKNFAEAFALVSALSEKSRLWVRFVVLAMQGNAIGFNKDSVFCQLLTDLNRANPKYFDFYIALIMNILSLDESLSRFLTDSSTPREAEELKVVWLKWIPMIFQFSSKLPIAFLTLLMKSDPAVFHLLYRQIILTKFLKENTKLDELIDFLKQQKEERTLREYEIAFSWLSRCETDLDRLDRVVSSHFVLYDWLLKGKRPSLFDHLVELTGGTFEQLGDFCAKNSPYFKTNMTICDYKTVAGLSFPSFGQKIASLALEATGTREARMDIVSLRGDSRTYYLVSPHIYRFSVREQLLMQSLRRLIESHQNSRIRSRFMFYPEFYQIHKSLTVVLAQSGMRNLHELAPFVNIPRALAMTASQLHDESPRSFVEKRVIGLPTDILFSWFIQTANGSLIDFLFSRQRFASSFACASFFQFVSQTSLPVIPSVLLSEDRKGLCLPNFLAGKRGIPHLPLTDQFLNFLPTFVLAGTVATTWHTLAAVISQNKETVRLYLCAVLTRELRKLKEKMLQRTEIAATNVNTDTDHDERSFAFVLFQHLMETSNNAFHAQPNGFAWI